MTPMINRITSLINRYTVWVSSRVGGGKLLHKKKNVKKI